MKIQLLALALFLSFLASKAQTPAARKYTIDQNSVVKDSAGVQYPYAVWQKLWGSYQYWPKAMNPNDPNTEFVLVKYTSQQKSDALARSPRPGDSKFFTTGQTIKPFKIKDLNGNKIEAKDWAGKTIVLNFWFIGCPPCRAEIPDLNQLALKYKDNLDVIFIAAALDEGWEVKDFIKEHPLAYHLVGDGRAIATMFNITAYPTNVVIDKQGKVMIHYSGGYQNGSYWLDRMIKHSDQSVM